eukprot:7277075-Prorocentrum_lima.AAC.1
MLDPCADFGRNPYASPTPEARARERGVRGTPKGAMQHPQGSQGWHPPTADEAPRQPSEWSPHCLQSTGGGQSWAFRVQRANGEAASLFGRRDGRH